MKKYLLPLLSVALLSSGAARADIFNNSTFDNSYVSVLGGWSSDPALSIGGGHAKMDDGYNVGARIGTRIGALPGFTVDADYFYNRSGYSGAASSLSSSSFMGDLLYHIPTGTPVSLYGGAGLGLVNDNLTGNLHGSSAVLGWQALGGAEFALSPATALFAEYRYQNAHDANIGAATGVGNTSNNVSVGVKFSL